MRKYSLAVFIGRFQPYHNGHHQVITKALELADEVLVLIGSSGGPRTLRNPFTLGERIGMIKRSFEHEDEQRLLFNYLEDHLYNDEKWIEQVQTAVKVVNPVGRSTALIGHSKDHSSYYLKLFPQWASEDVEQEHILSSTPMREAYFGWGEIPAGVSASTANFLVKWQERQEYNDLVAEQVFVDNYKSTWANSPYPPTFVTVDACVVQSGHVLLVKRKGFPGKGQWALPGGFLNQSEKIEDAVIRELREETKIKVPAPVLRGNIKERKVFDDPHRSSRGRTITHAFLIALPPDTTLPRVKGADDAEKAKWIPLSEVKRDMMYEDHYHIIENLTATI